jgi:hypothetical protein
MNDLHPEILSKDGKPQFAVLPYEEFLAVREALQKLNGGVIEPGPRYGAFHDNINAEELARWQGVKPIAKVEDLYGHGDPADWEGFDEAMERQRAAHSIG